MTDSPTESSVPTAPPAVSASDWQIDAVEIVEFSHDVSDIAMDSGGFNPVYCPGRTQTFGRYAITIETKGGARGEYVPMWGATPMALAQTKALAPALLGRNALDRETVFDDFRRAHRQYDHMGFGAIDIALWDLAGKALGVSVSTLLGSAGDPIPAYASTFHGDRNGGLDGPEAYADFAEVCERLGYRAFKAHGWTEGNVAEECAMVTGLGERVGDRMTLMLDPACELRTWTDALRVGRACDAAGFAWYEDPYRDSGVSEYGHRQLRAKLATPILQTEHVRGLAPKADWLISEATDLLRADPEYDLGITGAIKIAHLAEGFGIDVEVHACGPAHRHVAAAVKNTNWYEMALVHPKVGNPLPPVYACGYRDDLEAINPDGTVDVPSGPGLGVTYDWDYIDGAETGRNRWSGSGE